MWMLLPLVLFFVYHCFGLVVVSPNTTVLLHTFSTFGPPYDYSTNVTGQLVASSPITVCGGFGLDYTDRIVLAQRYANGRSCPYDLQVLTLQQMGAKAVIIMDTEKRDSMLWLTPSSMETSRRISILSIYVAYESGMILLDMLNLHSDVTITINGEGECTIATNETGRMVYLTVFGTLFILWIASSLYLSDQSIIRRVIKKQKKLYNRILPVVYKRDDVYHFPSFFGPRQIDSESAHFMEENRNSCPVCLCAFQNNDVIKILPCKHFFHKECIDPWFLKEATCPVCKQSLASTTSMSQSTSFINEELVKSIRLKRKINRYWGYLFGIVVLSSFFFL